MQAIILTSGKLLFYDLAKRIEQTFEIDYETLKVQFLERHYVALAEKSDNEQTITIKLFNLETSKVTKETRLPATDIISMYRKKGKLYIATDKGCFELTKDFAISRIYPQPCVGCGPSAIVVYYVKKGNVAYVLEDWNENILDYISYGRQIFFLGESKRHIYILVDNKIKKYGRVVEYSRLSIPSEYGLVRQGRILLTDKFNIFEFNISSSRVVRLLSLDDIILSFDFIFSK